MKTIPLSLRMAYAETGAALCYLVKIVTKAGEVRGFATADRRVIFNDGLGPVNYSAFQELRPQRIQEDATFDVDNTDLTGWFGMALDNLIMAGEFDFAEITIYRVSYLKLERGAEVMAHGTVGQVSLNRGTRGKRRVEFRSLTQQLKQTVNQLYSLTCRADFGDDRCRMPLVWENATVSFVGTNPFSDLVLSGLARPTGYFDLGVLEVMSGPNAGVTIEIESWSSTGAALLGFLSPKPFDVGTLVRVRRDCFKTESACIAYGNIRNMRAEHKTPVQDQSIMVPGAYLRSEGAK
ncbi:MAG: hypothetical protein DDT26_00038 [Dehalococcoidia bacterium]|nr:hypothetical protein [Chloroflexota bacterium]